MINPGFLMIAYLVFGIGCFLANLTARKFVTVVSTMFGLVALVLHGAFLIKRGIEAGHLPFTNTYETLIYMSFFVILLYFLTFWKFRSVVLGGFSGLVASILIALTSLLSSDIEPLLPSLKSNWLLFHVTSTILGYAFFAVAFCSAAAFLVSDFRSNYFQKHTTSPAKISEKLEYLDWLTYRLIAFGFAFLTLGITTGSIWANISWGRYWNWDSKETWAFATWLLYAACLHLKRMNYEPSKTMALLAFFGFFAVMFTYFGVNFWLSSLHAYG